MTDARLYRPRISTWWWVRKRSYTVFVLRELSSLFVAWTVVFLLLFLHALRSETTYRGFLDWAGSPWVIALNLVALAFVLLHTVTWFNLTPQAMDVRIDGRRVPGFHIIAGQYTGLVVVSLFVLWLVTIR